MTAVLSKQRVLGVVRRAYGPAMADFLARRLPDRIDLDDAADLSMLRCLGLSRDRLSEAWTAEW